MVSRRSTQPRLLKRPLRSFFLFGPRGVGKSTWLSQVLPHAKRFDLLDSRLFLELTGRPDRLESMVGNARRGSWVCIDEVQRVPVLLNEAHRLIESRGWHFALSGSSARKLRRGGTNLLGGRAITRLLEPFVSPELGDRFDLDAAIQWGQLPLVALDSRARADVLESYVHTYLKEEVREEGLIRRVEPFIRFLEIAGLLNGEQVVASNVARDAAVPRSSVDVYFSILEDTLLCHRLPAFVPRARVREQAHSKLYWFDPGVARAAAGLLGDAVDATWRGRALETLVFHELRVHNHVCGKRRKMAFYRTRQGAEIDFVVQTAAGTGSERPSIVCIEVKHATRWDDRWEKPMRELASSGAVRMKRMFGVYRGAEVLVREGVEVLPVREFLRRLHAGQVF